MAFALTACGATPAAPGDVDAGSRVDDGNAGDGTSGTGSSGGSNSGSSSSGGGSFGNDAAADSSTEGDGGLACGTTVCQTGEVCVVEGVSGGACLSPDDAGACPPGLMHTGACCTSPATAYFCQPLPAACGGTLACGCAVALCPGSTTCRVPDANELDCILPI
jgi:hypothetical protein